MFKIFVFLILSIPIGCLAQFTITGRVLNQADTKPVANASVFLSNATIGDRTAANGTFTLQNVTPGKYQMVISIVGFETYSEPIMVNNSNISLPDITIFPKTIALKEVSIKADPNRDKNFNLFYERFKSEFLGVSELAKECKILNPELLDLNYDEAKNTLKASSVDFLEIENNALGYKIKYLLTNFTQNSKGGEIHYEGPVLFTEMKGTPGQERSWQQNRKETYEGSAVHFLRSAMNNNLEEQGFKMLQLAIYVNPERPADSLIKARLKKFDVKKSDAGYKADSLLYWEKKAKLQKMLNKLMPFPLSKEDIITGTDQPGIFALGCNNDELLVIYNKNRHFTEIRSLADLNNLNYVLNKSTNKELTLLSLESPYIFFDNNGRILNPNSLILKGALGRNRVAQLLPVDYEASQNNTVVADSVLKNIENKLDAFGTSHVIEKVHLHLDRSFYGFGDTIWFKAYTVAGSYHQPSALSGVLYAELISEKDSVLKRLTLQLDSGMSHGDFAVPYTYKSGTYRLRAYTNWMLNDSANFYDQKIIIGGLISQSGAIPPKPELKPNDINHPLAPANPDVQFFPEGGDLVNGLRCKVAVKAINKNGQAADIQGVITDQDGNEMASFATQHLGMGLFPLTPQPDKRYQAKITCTDGSNFTADLPKAKDSGFTLTVNNSGDSIYVKVAANELFYKNNQNSAFYLLAQSGGKYYYSGSGKLANPVFTTSISKTRFPSGVVQFTLFSQSGEPLNERIIFIQNNDQLKLTVAAEKPAYSPMEKVKITLEAKDENDKAATGSFSASVTDETKAPVDEQSETTILTDLLLTSELKGYVEAPNYYFINESEKTRSDLDMLMLTQGYRRFEWKKILPGGSANITYQPQYALSLSGNIKTPSNKPIANGKIRLTSIRDHFAADTVSDANGNFTFSDLYLTDTAKVIVNAKKANGNTNVTISIKPLVYPAVNKAIDNYTPANQPEPVLAALKNTYITGQQGVLKKVIQLKEVQIKQKRTDNLANSPNMQLSANLNGPGSADEVIYGDQLLRNGGGDLSDILISKTFGVTWRNGLPYSLRGGHITGGGPMSIFVNGAQISPNELNNINPYDIFSIEVLRSLAYLSIYGSNAPNGALIITLRAGAANDSRNESVDGLITYKFNGFYKAREFYSPKYNSAKAAQITDDRKTIYWNPGIITDANGKSSFEFYNAGSNGVYRVVIEGIDEEGNLGIQVFRYTVE